MKRDIIDLTFFVRVCEMSPTFVRF